MPDELISARGIYKAWVLYNGTKDTTGSTSTANTSRQIVASYNVTSVSRSAVGTNAVNITSALADTSIGVSCTAQGAGYASQNAAGGNTTTVINISTRALSAPTTLADIDGVFVGVLD